MFPSNIGRSNISRNPTKFCKINTPSIDKKKLTQKPLKKQYSPIYV